jgi:hypothetical protein
VADYEVGVRAVEAAATREALEAVLAEAEGDGWTFRVTPRMPVLDRLFRVIVSAPSAVGLAAAREHLAAIVGAADFDLTDVGE